MQSILLMPLLNEGTDVWRPVEAEAFVNGHYLATEHGSDDEECKFIGRPTVVVDDKSRVLSAPASYAHSTLGHLQLCSVIGEGIMK